MSMMYELPPILKGSEEQKLTALRNYLVRMAYQLNSAESAPGVTYAAENKNTQSLSISASASSDNADEVRKNAKQLRQLIVKTVDRLSGDIASGADSAQSYTDTQLAAVTEKLMTRSDFGSYTESVESQIASTARGIIESYGYTQKIESNQDDIKLLQSYMTDIDGEIRRGFVIDPESGDTVTGIAISQKLRFTGEISRGTDGLSYYRLSEGQTFGLYTSTGWQFWIDGYKRGWFDSVDGMLHAANVAIEDTLRLGGNWQITDANGLGIKYIGG